MSLALATRGRLCARSSLSIATRGRLCAAGILPGGPKIGIGLPIDDVAILMVGADLPGLAVRCGDATGAVVSSCADSPSLGVSCGDAAGIELTEEEC